MQTDISSNISNICIALLLSLERKWASLVAQMVKRLPTVWETWVRSLGQEDPLEKEMATHSSTLAWKIPWTEERSRLQSMGSQRGGHDWATSHPRAEGGVGGSEGKAPPAMQETLVQSLGWEDPLEKEMATHSSILAWKILWMEEPSRLQSMGLQRVGHDWVTSLWALNYCLKYSESALKIF